MSTTPDPRLDRARGALTGLALGDALGMPTQGLSRAEIRADHGEITGLVAAGPRQVIAAGMPAGSITDDTEQALLVADLLLEADGHIDPREFALALSAWERGMAAKGSLDLLGPSTKRAVERIEAGVPPEEAGRHGATNGAAMRIAPVGIAVPPRPLGRLVDAVVEASLVTHHTTIGLSAAAAVAAAVSAGVDGATLDDAVDHAVRAADAAAPRGHWVAGAHVGPRIRWASGLLRAHPTAEWPGLLDELVGTDVAAQESVVAALAIVAVADEPWDALCLAASVGGDTDTIAAIAGAVLGAARGLAAWPVDAVARVLAVNRLDLDSRAVRLLDLRDRHR